MNEMIKHWSEEVRLKNLTEINKKYLLDDHRFIVCWAARRARKTLISLTKDVKFALDNDRKDNNIYICAPTVKQAKRIYWDRLNKMLKFVPKKVSLTDHLINISHNNNTIYVEGLDKPERIEGTFRVDRVHTTETADIKESFLFEHLLPVLADTNGFGLFEGTADYRKAWYKDLAMLATGNNVQKAEAYKGFSCENPDNTDWIGYTWQSVDVLGEKAIEEMKAIYEPTIFEQEFEGSFITHGSTVYFAFDTLENVTDVTFDPNKPIILCFDFNVDPMTCLINQEIDSIDGNIIYAVVKEFVMPRSNTKRTTLKVVEYLEHMNFQSTLEATGDYSGIATDSTNTNDGAYSDWVIIDEILHNFTGYKRVIRRTVSISDRTNALNSLFLNGKNQRRQLINKKECPYTYRDVTRQTYRKDGALEDEQGKTGHRSDALSYFAMNYYPLRSLN